MTPAHAHSPRIAARTVCSAPVTALSQVPGTGWAVAAAARDLVLLSLENCLHSPTATQPDHARWTLFQRERIHRIVWRPQAAGVLEGDRHEALILGGKEVALVQVDLKASPSLSVRHRFALDDVVGDGTFLGNERVAFVTLHCTLHVYELVDSHLSPSTSAAAPPFLRPILVVHAPQRPLLWAARFSKPAYPTRLRGEHVRSDDTADDEGPVRVAGGSMWGDAFVWDVSAPSKLFDPEREPPPSTGEFVTGSLRRLVGHKGAVFSATFSASADFLATCSDDRTIRMWDLSRLAPDFESLRSDSSVLPVIDPLLVPHQTLWGHEGRVWRTAFLESAPVSDSDSDSDFTSEAAPPPGSTRPSKTPPALVSVGEDATCRLWRDGKVVETWRDGHDGRSIWSVAIARPPHGAATRRGDSYALTGGADGAVRCWPLHAPSHVLPPTSEATSAMSTPALPALGKQPPQAKASKVTAFRAARVNPFRGPGRDAQQVVVTLSGDGSFRVDVDSSSRAIDTAPEQTLTSDQPVFYSSEAFAGSYSSAVIRLLSPLGPASIDPSLKETRRDVYAFSNRGFLLSATLSIDVEGCVKVSGTKEDPSTVKANDVDFVDFDDEDGQRRRRAVVWERAGHRLVVLEQSMDSPLRETSSSELDRSRPSLLPTCLCFLSHDLLIVGSIRGHLLLFRLSGGDRASATGGGAITEIGRLERVHADTINRIRVRERQSSSSLEGFDVWIVESVARDGASCLVEVQIPATSEQSSIRLIDRRQLTKGWLQDILPHGQYLALANSRAVILDRLGHTLESHRSPSKKALWQIVSDSAGKARYYRTQDDLLTHIQLGTDRSEPSTLLLGGLHGREIRTVAPFAVPDSQVTLVATAAENGVLTISRLDISGRLEPLYCDRYLPGSYKSLVWSAGSSGAGGTHALFACGTRASLSALSVTLITTEACGFELRVVPDGDELAGEGEELRAMDLAAVPLRRRGPGSHRLIAVGYSDGVTRTYLHNSGDGEFTPLDASTEEGKCILCVKTAVVQLPLEKEARTLLLTSASDGLLAVRDLSSLVLDPASRRDALPAPFFLYRPHPSGINSVSLRVSGSHIFLATGGDDNAVVLSLLELTAGSNPRAPISLTEVSRASLACAHSSTIQGLDLLDDQHLVSTSVDQRLNLYRFALRKSAAPHEAALSLALVDATCLDVADCSAQAVVPKSECGTGSQVLVVGIGAEFVSLENLSI